MKNILHKCKRTFIFCVITFTFLIATASGCSEQQQSHNFADPAQAVQSIFADYAPDQMVALDHTAFHTDDSFYLLYNKTQDSVSKVIVGRTAENQYYIKERAPWYEIGDGTAPQNIKFAVSGTHTIDGETKNFCIWKGAYTAERLKETLPDYEKIDSSSIKQPSKDVYTVFY